MTIKSGVRAFSPNCICAGKLPLEKTSSPGILSRSFIEESNKARVDAKRSGSVKRTLEKRQAERQIDQKVADQFNSGRLLACISSRPGQSGRVDGYVLEGRELEFYLKKLERKKK